VEPRTQKTSNHFNGFPVFINTRVAPHPNPRIADPHILLDICPQLIHPQVALVTMSLANPIRCLLASATFFCAATQCLAQGTVTFDGPPVQPPGMDRMVQAYQEAGVRFAPIPETDGFVMGGSNPPTGWPNNGTAFVGASLGNSLMFGMLDGGNTAVENLQITCSCFSFSEAPDDGPLSSTYYYPKNYGVEQDTFPAPAPPPPYSTYLNFPAPIDPNGTWSLYIVDDDGTLGSGSISGSWCLTFY
jgi:hypothetical protein